MARVYVNVLKIQCIFCIVNIRQEIIEDLFVWDKSQIKKTNDLEISLFTNN